MPQSPHRLRNDLKCVEWDVKPCPTQPSLPADSHHSSDVVYIKEEEEQDHASHTAVARLKKGQR